MVTLGEDIEKLFPVWDMLTNLQKDAVRKSAIAKSFQKGDRLASGSGDCAGLFIVQSGQLRAFFMSEKGKEITLYHLLERDMCLFSASCMLKNIQFDVFVEAEKAVNAILIPTGVYQKLTEESLAVANYTSQLMASRFSDAMWVMQQVLFNSFDSRLATFIIDRSNIDESEVLEITHEEIARHMGSAREVVTRMLKRFQADGLVSISRKSIIITNYDGLRNLL